MLAPEISIRGNYSYDKKGQFYATTKIYGYIKEEYIDEDYKFWLGLLNSNLFWFFLKNTGYILRGGYFTFKTNYIEPFPVPEIIDINLSTNISNLVNKILDNSILGNQNSNIELENKIDSLIYEIYNLNLEDINYIESNINVYEV